MSGDLAAHEFYLGRAGRNRTASLTDEANTLVLMEAMHGRHAEIAAGLTPGRTRTFTGRSRTVTVTGTPVNRELFRHMDAVTPLAEVYASVCQAVPEASYEVARRELEDLYRALHPHGHLYLLRQGSYGRRVPDYTRLPPA